MSKWIEFRDDDEAYRDWIATNTSGYVLNLKNLKTKGDPTYVVLHRADCRSISSNKMAEGAYTTRGYRKVCALEIVDLVGAAIAEGRGDGSFSKRCSHCGA